VPAGDIWLTGPRPNDARRLTHNRAAFVPVSSSGDGTKLLVGAISGRWAVVVPSGRTRAIAPRLAGASAQGLSTDGKTVLVAVGCAGDFAGPHHGYIATIPFTGGKADIIARGPCAASWNAGY